MRRRRPALAALGRFWQASAPMGFRFLAGLAVAIIAGVGLVATAGAHIPPGVQIDEAWIRWLPGNVPYAAYVTVNNRGDHAATLSGTSSWAFADVSLHQTRTEGSVTTMVPVNAVTIAPHTRLSFATTGYHLMLMHPAKPVAPGDQVPITLHFAGDTSLTVMFVVRAPNGNR